MRKVKRLLELNANYYLRRRTPTFVYSMERSGSVALLGSLKAHGVFVIGAHYLDPEKLATRRTSGSARWAIRHIISKRKPAKIISLVRRPIENMLSTFARSEYGERRVQRTGASNEEVQSDRERLSAEFCRNYLDAGRHLRLLEWFTTEYQAALRIDVFKHPFDKESGFARFREGPYDVLIVRTELPDAQKSELVADFVGIAALDLSRTVSVSDDRRRLPPGSPGDQTDYAATYEALKQGVVIPQKYLDAIVDSRYVQYFFTQGERDDMREKYGGELVQER